MAQPQIDASVIVATYNQLEATTLALRALFAQKTGYRFEVVVCDDGSDSATIGGRRNVIEAAPVPAYLTWQQDRGFRAAASRNNGIRLARGRIVIMVDGDMVPEEDFVEAHMRTHERDRVVAVGRRLWRNPEGTEIGRSDIQALWPLLRGDDAIDRLSRATEAFEMLYRHVLWKAAPWMTCSTCNISVPKSPLVEFDETFVGWGYEDYDLFYGLNSVHGFEVIPIEVDAYEVHGRVDKGETWKQDHFVGHLVNGFRFQDKWARTGLKIEQSIPRYDLDPETDCWWFSSLPIVGGRTNDFPAYVERTRQWLKEKGLYPKVSEVAFGPYAAIEASYNEGIHPVLD